jgi:hypothetical protein
MTVMRDNMQYYEVGYKLISYNTTVLAGGLENLPRPLD